MYQFITEDFENDTKKFLPLKIMYGPLVLIGIQWGFVKIGPEIMKGCTVLN